MLSARRFLARDAVRNAAEDGVRLAVARMNADVGTAAKANGAISDRESLFKTKVGDTAVEVFARKRGDEILLLGVGNKNEERARALGGNATCGPYGEGWRVFVSIPKQDPAQQTTQGA